MDGYLFTEMAQNVDFCSMLNKISFYLVVNNVVRVVTKALSALNIVSIDDLLNKSKI